ncbi:hypothetical protein HZA56_10835 [Candidatus Poribacteria bacterium]|nr:hypothetical protein [Candidatus Poribacteria bacterium]
MTANRLPVATIAFFFVLVWLGLFFFPGEAICASTDSATILVRVCDDPDNDGLCTPDDNCPGDYNPSQENNDGDDSGDACDPDDDNDGYSDVLEQSMDSDPLNSTSQPFAANLVLSPTQTQFNVGASEQLDVVGTFQPQAGGSIQYDMTCLVEYKVSVSGIVSIGACGSILGQAAGTTNIWAEQVVNSQTVATSNPASVTVLNPTFSFVPDDYATIQAALDASTDGDTIIVRDGTYTGASNKNLDFRGKALTLQSENGPANCIINCELDGRGFLFHSAEGSGSIVNGFTITNGFTDYGGGIYPYYSSPTITNCVVSGNTAYVGGGILLAGSSATIRNCLITNNVATYGGGVYFSLSSAFLKNCTISGNSAYAGGGVWSFASSITATNAILWNDSATVGLEIGLNSTSSFDISFSDIEGGAEGVEIEAGSTLIWDAQSNITTNPMFATGSLGDYYLSQIAAGQSSNSPCIDKGDAMAADLGLDLLTTRTDQAGDIGIVDLGYHYASAPQLTGISLVSPADSSILSTPPTFTWRTDGGINNAFAVDVSLLPAGPTWSTWNSLGQIIYGTNWTMPDSIWNMIPSGTAFSWKVRGMDLASGTPTIITSDKVWSFSKY